MIFGREAVRSTAELPRLTAGRAEDTYASAEAGNGKEVGDGTGAGSGGLGLGAGHQTDGGPTATATATAHQLPPERPAARRAAPDGAPGWPGLPGAFFTP